MKTSVTSLAMAAALVSSAAHAITAGQNPDTTPLVNPWNGQVVNEWKFVGQYNNQSAVQIAPQWILLSDHNNEQPPGLVFQNKLGSSTTAACPLSNLCRLTSALTPPPPLQFPPMVDMASTTTDRSRMARFGLLLGVGFGGGRSAAWAGLDGVPYQYTAAGTAAKVLDLATPSTPVFKDSTFPVGIGGDSGGAVYWYSNSGLPAMSGIMERNLPLHLSVNGNHPFTTAFITQVQNIMSSYGDTPVGYRSFYGQSEGRTLTSPPITAAVIPSASNTTHTRISWTAPTAAGSETISGYRVQVAFQADDSGPGQVVQTFSLPASANYADLNNLLETGYYVACATPENVAGVGSSLRATSAGGTDIADVVALGCNAFQAGTPPDVIGAYITRSLIPGTSNYQFSGSWLASSFTGIANYAYKLIIKQPGGSTSTISSTTPGTSFSNVGSVPAGRQVCLEVRARSTANVESRLVNKYCLNI